MTKSFAVILLVLVALCFADDICTNPTGSCDFYTKCLEPIVQCGAEGYPVNYGFKYCTKFHQAPFKSNDSVVWMEGVALCLQRALLPVVQGKLTMNCKQLTDFAFDSHPRCYTALPNSICKLRNISDIKTIATTVEPRDLLTLRSAKQIFGVLKICGFEQLLRTTFD